MAPTGEARGQVQERAAVPQGQPSDNHAEPMPGLGWFFRTPFSKDWLFWVGVACVVWSLVPGGSYLTLMFMVLVPYWALGALVSRRRRKGRPPVRRLRTRGWGLDAWCGVFTAFALGYGAFLVLETIWFALKVQGLQ